MILLSNVIVITTIYLNHQVSRKTCEISNIVSNDILSSER